MHLLAKEAARLLWPEYFVWPVAIDGLGFHAATTLQGRRHWLNDLPINIVEPMPRLLPGIRVRIPSRDWLVLGLEPSPHRRLDEAAIVLAPSLGISAGSLCTFYWVPQH